MTYILSRERDADDYNDRRMELWNSYQARIQAMKDVFPPNAFAIATSDWWYSFEEPGAPHDSELIEFSITSSPKNSKNELVIKLESCFGGIITLRYPRLVRYHLSTPPQPFWRTYRYKPNPPGGNRRRTARLMAPPDRKKFEYWGVRRFCPHGDWRFDEFDLSPDGFLVHTIEWADGPVWKIIADDLIYQFEPAGPAPA